MSEVPVSLSAAVTALSDRATLLSREATEVRDRPPAPPSPPTKNPAEVVDTTIAGVGSTRADLGSTFGDFKALRTDAALRGLLGAAGEVLTALEPGTLDSLPDDPADLAGTEVHQALIIEGLLASFDEERDDEGHLTNRTTRDAYAKWAARRDELDPVVRQHLADLSTRLEGAAEGAAPYLLPEPTPAPTRKREVWR